MVLETLRRLQNILCESCPLTFRPRAGCKCDKVMTLFTAVPYLRVGESATSIESANIGDCRAAQNPGGVRTFFFCINICHRAYF